MSDGWIGVDGAPLDRVERFEDGASVAVDARGIRVIEGGRAAEASWREVFGAERFSSEGTPTCFVLVPRRPPKPPWFRITADMLPGSLRSAGLAGLEQLVDHRAREQGYREAARTVARLSPDELRRRVIAGHEIPGALQVPVRAESLGHAIVESAITAARAAAHRLRLRSGPPVKRSLIVAPDGLVGAHRRGVVAVPWTDVERFGIETATDGSQSLLVRDRRGATLVQLPAARFEVPLRLVLAVAMQYAERLRPIRVIGEDPQSGK